MSDGRTMPSLNGRWSRRRFWIVFGGALSGLVLLDLLASHVPAFAGDWTVLVIAAPLVVIGWGASVLRLHDLGLSGRWTVLAAAPFVAAFAVMWIAGAAGADAERIRTVGEWVLAGGLAGVLLLAALRLGLTPSVRTMNGYGPPAERGGAAGRKTPKRARAAASSARSNASMPPAATPKRSSEVTP